MLNRPMSNAEVWLCVCVCVCVWGGGGEGGGGGLHVYVPTSLPFCMQVVYLTELIMTSQNLMRNFAFRQLCSRGLDKTQAKLFSRSCVSQRDIQRVFTFYQWLVVSYTKYQPYGEQQDYSRRAVLVALGIVYYMRLNSQSRKDYEQYLDKQFRLPNEVSFSEVR